MSNDSDNTAHPSPLLPLVAAATGGEGSPSVQAEVNPTTAHLGDLITLSIRVSHPATLIVDLPAFQKNLGTFEVYSSTQLPAEFNGPQVTEHFQAQLQDFTTGPQLLPGLDIAYQDLQGARHVLKTPELQVTIQEMPPGPKDKGDIRGIVGVIGPVAWSPWWWAIGVVLLVVAGILLWNKRQRVLQGPPPPPPVPADETALKKLEELKAGPWLTTGRIKEFYIALSDILRAYLEEGFQIPALERTTGELMRGVQKHPAFQSKHQLELRELLEECDLVKFAKYRPDAADALKAHETAVRFIGQTRAALKKETS